MNEQKIEQIKDAVRQLMQLIIARGAPLSEEVKVQLARVVEHAERRIQELRSQEDLEPEGPPIVGLPPPEEKLPPSPYPSSNINAFKYDPKTQKLLVKFMGKDTANSGPTYSYQGVPDYIVDIFARGAVGPKTTGKNKYHAWFKGITPSHGAAMAALIKKGPYPYQKVA